MSDRLLRRREVEHRTGLPRSTLYDLVAAGDFPRPIRLTKTTVAWPESVVDAWIEDRIARSAYECVA